MADQSGEFPTILGPDAKFKGELTFEKGLRLLGEFEGTINTAGRLHVAKDAKLNANVDAGGIVIEGNVKGNLTASDRIELKANAKYEGDLTASKLVVDEGASLVGKIAVGPDVAKSSGRGPSSSPGINRPAAQGGGSPSGSPSQQGGGKQ